MAAGVGGFLVAAAGLTGAAATAAAVAINAALYVGLSAVSGRLLAKSPKFNTFQPRDIVVRSGSQPKIVVYGEAVVGGVLAYMNSKPITGNNNFELWACIVHAAHEVSDITDIYYNTDKLESGTNFTWSGGTATIDSGVWHADDATHEAATVWKFLGGASQSLPTAFTDAFSELTTSHRLRGYSGTIHKFQVFDESEEIFKNGEPGNIRGKVHGRIIYDPRLDTSPGANPDNATYFAWTQNPVLIAVDYMRSYWGFPASRFDWDHIDAQADKCDVLVPVPPAASPQNTQARYTCNGAISLGDSHNTNLSRILATCLGRRSTVNGLIRITVGDDQTPDVTLDETDIIGAIIVRPAVPREERYNKVIGTYISELAGFVETDFLPVEDAGFVSRDNGEEISRALELGMVTNEYQAQRIGYKELQQSDQQTTVEVPLRWSGLRLTPGTYVSLTYPKFSWSSKLFRCISLKIGERGIPVTAVLREDSASAWDDPEVADYSTRDIFGVVVPAANEPPPPTSMTAVTNLNGNYVSWVNPTGRDSWDFVRVYASDTSAWSGASLVGDRIVSGEFYHRAVGPKYYWVRSVSNGIESNREPNSDTSDRTATSLGLLASENVFESDDFGDGSQAQWEARWSELGGNDPEKSNQVVTGKPGGFAWEFGNNSGNDGAYRWIDRRRARTVVDNRLYRVFAWVRRVAGSGTIYIGVQGFKGNVRAGLGAYVSNSGADNTSQPHTFGANAYDPPDTNWHLVEGYFIKGQAYAFRAGTPEDPHVLHPDVEYVTPMFLINYSNVAGVTQIGFVGLEETDRRALPLATGGNLIIDPTFGQQYADRGVTLVPTTGLVPADFRYWGASVSTWALNTTAGEHGGLAARLPANVNGTLIASRFIPASNAERFFMSLRVNFGSGYNGTLSVDMYLYDENRSFLATVSMNAIGSPTTGAWLSANYSGVINNTSARFVRFGLAATSGTAGTITVQSLQASRQPFPVTGDDPTVTSTASLPVLVFSTYEAGGWSTSPLDSVVEFRRGSVLIASRTVRGTVDEVAPDEGDVTPSNVSNTGEATSYSADAAGTSGNITVTHTASGQIRIVPWASDLPGYSGGPTK